MNSAYLIRRLSGTERAENDEKLKRGDKTALFFNYESLDLYNSKTDKAKLFALGGNQTLSPGVANGTVKIPADMIGVDDQAELISMVYSLLKPDDISGGLDGKGLHNIVEKFFMPYFVNQKRKRLEIDKALKNARKFTFFCFCYGAKALMDINEYLEERLKIVGYKRGEIGEILKQFVVICYGPIKNNYKNTVFQVKSIDDEVNGKIYIEEILEYFRENPREKENWYIGKELYLAGGKIIKQDNGYNLYVQDISNPNSSAIQKEHTVKVLARAKQFGIDLSTTSIRGDYASLCVAYVLASAVANSIRNEHEFVPFDLDKIVETCKQFVEEETNLEEEKSRKASIIKKYIEIENLNLPKSETNLNP